MRVDTIILIRSEEIDLINVTQYFFDVFPINRGALMLGGKEAVMGLLELFF